MPLDTILLVDTSGSMAGRGIRELKAACKTFLDGVEETARQTGLKENVAIVEFHASARIVQSLTNNYGRCRNAVESLNAGGGTAMFDGLMEALKEILSNGGILRIHGLVMTPRIILMTDGYPTDSGGEQEAKKKVLSAAIGFGPVGWRECGLPHPVPIACVGCGACDLELLQAIAKLTNGMCVVGNVGELSTFFKRQVLLIRFAAKFSSDMQRLRSQLALAAFLRDLGEAVEQAEVEAMMRLLLAMVISSDDDERPSVAQGGPSPRALPPGSSGASARTPPSARVVPMEQRRIVAVRTVVTQPPARPSSSSTSSSSSAANRQNPRSSSDESGRCSIQ